MIEIKSKLRKWGNSFGLVVPQKAVEEENFREGDEITVLLSGKRPNLKKLFGAHKFKEPVEEIMKQIDNELYND